MLNALLSHWMTYVYLVYVVLLVALCVAFRPRTNPISWKLRNLRSRRKVAPVTRHE
jgi:hypothetical protein